MMFKNKALLLVIGTTICLLALSFFLVFKARDSIPWRTDYAAAREAAQERQQLLLAYLYTDWCSYCRQMESETFTSGEIIESMGDEYVWLKLNAEQDPDGIELRQRFFVSSYPTILILEETGEEVDRIQGYVPADQFESLIIRYVSNPDSFGKVRQHAQEQPESVDAQYALAAKHLERAELDNAVSQLERVLELDPDNQSGKAPDTYYYMALALASQEKNEAAFEQLALLEQRFPESDYVPDGLLLRSRIHLHSGDLPRARQSFRDFLQRYPDHFYAKQIQRMLSQTDKDSAGNGR